MYHRKAWNLFRQIDIFLDQHIFILFMLAATIFLRVPSFAEPYWYGDEGIYLTIGNSLRAGERLYVDIMDHKTPLIYYFAALAGNQLGFRVMALVSVSVSVFAFFHLIKDFFDQKWQKYLAIILFVLFINLPGYEGNIPNGELFMMPFVLLGFIAFQQTRLYSQFFTSSKETSLRSKDLLMYILSGALFGIATLIKVPAVFEMGTLFVLCWMSGIALFFSTKKSFREKIFTTRPAVLALLTVIVGWLSIIFLSLFYYWLRGSLTEYINFGLLYNFRYAGNWIPNLKWPFLQFLLDTKFKFLLMFGVVLFFTFIRKLLSPKVIFTATWLTVTLVATTLSNRPYPHYFLQLAPSVALMATLSIGYLWQSLKDLFTGGKTILTSLCHAAITLLFIWIVSSTLQLIGVSRYPTTQYYTHFLDAVTGKITWDEYRNRFDAHVRQNYQVNAILQQSPEKEIFIWGNNPILYAQSGKNPTGRFIVAFHVADFNAYQETLDSVVTKSPEYILTMNEERPLNGLEPFLLENYTRYHNYSDFTLWRRK